MHLRVCGSAILVCSHLRTSEEFTHDSMPNSGACRIATGFKRCRKWLMKLRRTRRLCVLTLASLA